MTSDTLKIKRIYEQADATDGKRILVDRLWPRGVSKASAAIDVWLKDIAPSPELRKWFCHDPDRFAEFRVAYTMELAKQPEQMAAIRQVVDWAQEGPVTLVYAAKDATYNHAVVLREFLDEQFH